MLAPALARLIAQAEAPETPQSWLMTQGVLGVAVLVLGLGFLFLARRLVKERDELASQREGMITTLLEVVPLLARTTEVLEQRKILDEQNLAVKREALEAQIAMRALVEEMRRLLEKIR